MSDDARTPDTNRLADEVAELRRFLGEHILKQAERLTKQETRSDAFDAALKEIAAAVSRGFDDLRRELVTRREHDDMARRVTSLETAQKTLEAAASETRGKQRVIAGLSAAGGVVVGTIIKWLVEQIAKAM